MTIIKPATEQLRSNYLRLTPKSMEKAQTFFRNRAEAKPHLAWMETVFLRTLEQIVRGQMRSKLPAEAIEVLPTNDTKYFEHYTNLAEREDYYREIGTTAIMNGELLVIDLAAGMATGYGGGAKGAVKALIDTRYDTKKEMSYLDIKRASYLKLQRKFQRHVLAAEMISDDTEKDIRNNLEEFGKQNNVTPIIIPDGTSRERIEMIWNTNKDHWQDVIIVPLIRQPSTYLISKDGKEVGKEYMKGHGDFFDVVQSQLKDLMEITGIKYVLSSNIDNTGALISRSILGHFIEQAQQEQIDAMMEAAQKYEGDKGGVPASIYGNPSILEEAFVPAEWKARFMGTETFPYANTNTFWFTAKALLGREFSLPLMISKEQPDENQTWLKVESIMAHGLQGMNWKTLVIDRGRRFTPAKFLTDLWIGRTNWMQMHDGVLMPAMYDGEYVRKPQVEVSNLILSKVDHLKDRIFGAGSYDYMARLQSLLMGGEGKHFHESGAYSTLSPIAYEGDVMVIFRYRQGQPSGTLVVGGASCSDRLTLADSAIVVEPGEVVVKKKSVIGQIDPRIDKKYLSDFLGNAVRWPPRQIKRIMDKFFPPPIELDTRPIDIDEVNTEKYLQQLDLIHQRELNILSVVFKVEGSLVYQVEYKPFEKDGKRIMWPHLRIKKGSKRGIAEMYPSRVDEEQKPAKDHKAGTILPNPNQIYIDPVNPGKGSAFAGKHYVAVPDRGGNRIILLIGEFDESIDGLVKDEALQHQYKTLVDFAGDEGMTVDKELEYKIRQLFHQVKWSDFFELSIGEIYRNDIKPEINP